MHNCENKNCVKATNLTTNEVIYNPLYAVNQHLGINPGVVKMSCERLNCRIGISKKDIMNTKR